MKVINHYIFKIENLFYKLKRNLKLFPSVESIVADSIEVYKSNNPKIKLLYIAVKYDYNIPYQGISYEEYNFFYTLKNMQNIDIVRFDFYTIVRKYGQIFANQVLDEIIFLENPDKLLLLLYHDKFDHQLIKKISTVYGVDTILWLFDDDKRFGETKEITSCFLSCVTAYRYRHKARIKSGINSKLAQFAANHYLYRKLPVKKEYDVVFVGQNFENREMYINYLLKNSINAKVFGKGWKNSKRVTQREMVEIMNKAKIVLNFSSSAGNPNLKFIKGRVFEVPATGSFLLTEICNELDEHFDIGKHLDVFNDKEELLIKVNYYLENEKEREEIAKNGMNHVLSNYTFEKYLKEIIF